MVLSPKQVNTYQTEGVVLLRGLFLQHVERLRKGVEINFKTPGQYASKNEKVGETGLFFDDYCNWTRIPQFQEVIEDPTIINTAGRLMGSSRVQMFHDHVLIKEPHTSMETPWHSDAPYYFVEGKKTISFWVALDPIRDASLRCVVGSHKWEKDILPTRWASEAAFFEGDYMPVPDPIAEGMNIREWEMEPGDAVAFHFRTLHGARGNKTEARRRAFSLRLIGDDARYVNRPGPTSPPFSGHGMVSGQRLRTDWFPILR